MNERGSDRPRTMRPNPSSAPATKGHDTVLKAIQSQERTVTVQLISGEVRKGKLVGRDKYTVTVRTEDGIRRLLYKHAIEEIFADEAAKQEI